MTTATSRLWAPTSRRRATSGGGRYRSQRFVEHIPFVGGLNSKVTSSNNRDKPSRTSKSKSNSQTSSSSSSSSTITPQERAIFNRIFKDIVKSTSDDDDDGPTKSCASKSDSDDDDGKDIISPIEDLHTFLESISGRSPIMGGKPYRPEDDLSFREGKPADEDEAAPAVQGRQEGEAMSSVEHEHRRKAVMHYPESLRDAASFAMLRKIRKQSQPISGREEDDDGHDDQAQTQAHTNAQSMEHQPETLKRVETLLRAAKTDRELWIVLDQEVFSIITHMDEAEHAVFSEKRQSTNKGQTKKKRERNKTRESMSRDEGETNMSTHPNGDTRASDAALAIAAPRSPVSTIGPRYARLLFVAMRILYRNFHLPSECLALFARVKSLGPVSYILGASTSMYNEMLHITWVSYADFHAVVHLLTEMDRGGLEFSPRTVRILEAIATEQERVGQGQLGEVMRDLWELDPMTSGLEKIHHWIDVVQERLIEQATNTADAEQAVVS